MNPLKPWQRIPAWWVCAECRQPATGSCYATGLVAFTCDEHHDHVTYMLMEKLGYGAVGGLSWLRDSWPRWAASTLSVLGRRIWPPSRRWARQYLTEEARVEAILGPLPPTPFARDSA